MAYLGRALGFVDQIAEVLENMHYDPNSRRHIAKCLECFLRYQYMALPPCHTMCQFTVINGDELSCQLYQRSADMFLGVPFNIATYSIAYTYACTTAQDLEVGDFIWTGGDCHIYSNHIRAS